MPRPPWKPEHIKYLQENYLQQTNREIAIILNKTAKAVNSMLKRNKLKRPPELSRAMSKINVNLPDKLHAWTSEDDDYIRQNYLEKINKEMAQKLGVSLSAVENRIGILDLKRPEKIRKKMQAHTQFKKGQTAWNKGKTGYMGANSASFKKGHIPHNTKHDGAIVTRHHKRGNHSIKWIRISPGNWQQLNQYNWEKATGRKFPKGHVLRFKDSDTLNCEPENLELISKSQHCRLNYNGEKAGKTLLNNDNYIAATMSRKDKNLRIEILKHPELIKLKRLELKQRRALNEAKKSN